MTTEQDTDCGVALSHAIFMKKTKQKKIRGGLHSTAFWQCLSSTGLCLGLSHPPDIRVAQVPRRHRSEDLNSQGCRDSCAAHGCKGHRDRDSALC